MIGSRQFFTGPKIRIAFLVALWSSVLIGWQFRVSLVTTASAQVVGGSRLAEVRERVERRFERELPQKRKGAPVFIRIFKESEELEVWLKAGRRYALFKTYPISNYGGGTLAPKLAEGDGQAPTGFYTVGKSQLKPDSEFHLAFDLGFPNAYDKAKGRTGSFLMVHGSRVSIGCYAMTNPLIEEIYLLVDAALTNGQKAVPVHAFPFRMTAERMQKAAADEDEKPWLAEWENLREGFDLFERTRVPFAVQAGPNGRYVFR